MSVDHIRYDILAQDALRDMVRKVLAEVAKSGLKGDHHFNITFMTGAPGVRLPARLREQYTQEMTSVLQYQFWDLKAGTETFEVGLSFGGVPEKLTVPFTAITSFVDPSVQFALQFQAIPAGDEAAAPTARPDPPAAKSAVQSAAEPAAATTAKLTAKPGPKPRRPARPSAPASVPAIPATSDDSAAAAPPSDPAADKGGAEVVRLDRFRKK